MPKGDNTRRVTDEQILESWKETPSATAIARKFKIDARGIATRLSRLRDRGHVLPSPDSRSPYYNLAARPKMLVTYDRVEVKLTVENGTLLVISDQHFWPDCVPTMHRAYCHLAAQIKPFATIWNGDAFDGATISRYPSIGWENKPTVETELQAVSDRSGEVMKAAPAAKRIWTAGNHDLRFESRLASHAPEYRKVQGIHLKDHFPEWTPAWFITVNEGTPSHTEIRHREKGGVHAGYNNTKESGVTMVTGHDHRADVVTYNDRRGQRYGVRAGMGADSPRDPQFVNYLEGKLSNWQSAMAVLTYRNGMLLYPELVLRVDDDTVQFRGELIKV